MTWEEKVEKFGQPKYDTTYSTKVINYKTKNIVDVDLVFVDESDYSWQTIDGEELNEWAWDVIEWIER